LVLLAAAFVLIGCYPRRYACYRTCTASREAAPAVVKPLPAPGATIDAPAVLTGLTPTGFLSDYTRLKPNPDRPGSLAWEKEGLDLRVYDQLLIEPVRVLLAADAYAKVPQEVQLKASEYFETILFETIDPYYSVVKEPGPHVLRVKLALTALDAASASDGEPAVGTGGAALEGEFVDSVTGDSLLMVVSRIQGSDRGSADVDAEWKPVEGAFREWADRLLDYLDSFKEE
jgi:hypothetical protein